MEDLFESPLLSEAEMESAWERRDAGYDGAFVFGCRTTGIYCRPSCPSRPKRENIEFYAGPGPALRAGYRPCKRCRPDEANGEVPEWMTSLIAEVMKDPACSWKAEDLRQRGLVPETVRRAFQKYYGMTFAAWARALRLSEAFTQIRQGESLEEVLLDQGYQSHSGFRSAYGKAVGQPPERSRTEGVPALFSRIFSTRLGPMIAVAGDEGIALLEFTDVRGLERQFRSMREALKRPVFPGEHPMLDRLEKTLNRYFADPSTPLDPPLLMVGSEFQQRVWRTLCTIPSGATWSYQQLAEAMGDPKTVRAVARANGGNRLYLLVPCHRVVGKSADDLGGYGGGIWRKHWLLRHEARS